MAHGVTGEVSSSLDLLADWKDKLLKGNATPDFANGDSADPVDLNNKIPDASFRDRSGREVSVTPVVVEFRRLIQSGDDGCVVPGISNKELLHAVVGLYAVSLCEMTPDTLYATVCERWAKTLVLLRSTPDTALDLKERKSSFSSGKTSASKTHDVPGHFKVKPGPRLPKEVDAEGDCYAGEESQPNVFRDVYSDTEDEDSDEEETSEDFSKGMYSFIQSAVSRREQRQTKGPVASCHVGVENRLIGAITFKKTYIKPNERVMHLTLVAVRKRFQKFGIGKYLLAQVKDPHLVGSFDAVVVHADNSAIPFFRRYGFSDDIVLNSKFVELAEQFTNCTLMCHLPPFTGQTLLSSVAPELDVIAMDKEIQKWREKSLEAYRAETTCVDRLRNEIIYLKALSDSQQEIINRLTSENSRLRSEKLRIEKEFTQYRIVNGVTLFGESLNEEEDEINTAALIRESRRTASEDAVRTGSKTYDHSKDSEEFYTATQEFQEGMKKDRSVINSFVVKMVNKAVLERHVDTKFNQKKRNLQNPSAVERLYFCGSLEKPRRTEEILKNGFSEKDFSHGEYGRGLYFSRYPSKAAQFSAFGKLIIALVAVGDPQVVAEKKRTRCGAGDEFDSICTPGRLHKPDIGEEESASCEEIVVFDANQAKPLYLLEYAATAAS